MPGTTPEITSKKVSQHMCGNSLALGTCQEALLLQDKSRHVKNRAFCDWMAMRLHLSCETSLVMPQVGCAHGRSREVAEGLRRPSDELFARSLACLPPTADLQPMALCKGLVE